MDILLRGKTSGAVATDPIKMVSNETTLTILGLLLAFAGLIGYGTFKIIHYEVMKSVEGERKKSKIETQVNTGFAIWQTYVYGKAVNKGEERERGVLTKLLDQSIEETEKALKIIADLDEEAKKDDEVLICVCKNNLSYYYAERRYEKDRAITYALINDVMEKIKKYPDRATEWGKSYEFIKKQYVPT